MFLTEKDYKVYIKEDQLDILTQADDNIRESAELSAQEEMASFLRGRYDMDLLFIDVFPYDESTTYEVDEHIVLNDTIYYALQQTTGDDPEAAGSLFWKKGDQRNKLIVMRLVDMALYHLHSSINPRNIPTLRRERYDGDNPEQTGGAIGWLKGVNKGIYNPDLPTYDTVDETDISNPIKFGSQEKQNNSY